MRRSLIDGSEISLGSIADGVEVDNTLVISVVRIRKRAVWASAEGGALCWFWEMDAKKLEIHAVETESDLLFRSWALIFSSIDDMTKVLVQQQDICSTRYFETRVCY